MPSARKAQNPQLASKIEQLAIHLAPLVQVTTGHVHPAFPATLLNYHLLVESELDSLAHFYHQHTPSLYTRQYPIPMKWRAGLTLQEKRRKWGRFIGLRGCETPFVDKTEEMILEEARQARWKDEEMLRGKTRWY